MINEDLYRQCLESVAPRENLAALGVSVSGFRHQPKLLYSDDDIRREIIMAMRRRKSVTTYDVCLMVRADAGNIKSLMLSMVRSGEIMSGSDSGSNKRIYWLPENDDGFVPQARRSKTTQEGAARIKVSYPRNERTACDREKTFAAVTSKWMHANVISSKCGIRVPIVRGHLKRLLEMGLIEEKKVNYKSYWRLSNG